MKRIIVPLLVATAAASLFADDHSMVINLNDGKTYAIHNKDIKTIKFSKNDLHDKYYVFSSDTVFLHDTLYIDKIITEYETVYVHDTIVQTKEIVLHDTITNFVTLHDTINVEVPVYVHDTIYIETPEINNMHNGHEYVDLGLKDEYGNSILWATCNVGADRPEDIGDHFAWGDTNPDNYIAAWSYFDTTDRGETYIKYNTNGGKTTLDLEDDAAHVNWGGKWRMPTQSELYQLRKECTWVWDTAKKGYIVSNRNDSEKSIFLPAAGTRYMWDTQKVGVDGNYWSSTLDQFTDGKALYISFDSKTIIWFSARIVGQSVRPVFVNE